MHRYIIRRLLLNVPVLLGVSIIVFSLMRILPGDVVYSVLGAQAGVSEESLQRIRRELGLDKPFHEQYFVWVGGMLQGDMGKSLTTGRSVRDELVRRIPITAQLAVMSLLLAIVISIPVGIISATRQDSWSDYFGRLFAIGGLSIPDFWLGTVALVFLAVYARYSPPIDYASPIDDLGKNMELYLLPTVILGIRLSATSMRMTRSTMLEVLRQDYIRTAWSKGLKERAVIYRHALKNAMIPVITILGTQLSNLLGGTVVIETIFLIPGIGRLTLEAISSRDYTQVQGNIVFFAVIMITMNLIVDITYAWFDPRIRYA